MVTKLTYPPGSQKKFFKTLNKDPKAYIDSQMDLINTLKEVIDHEITRTNLMASRTAFDMATNEMKADFCLQYLADYPNKIKISAEDLETVTNNVETILALLNEIKTQQKEVLEREFTIWDILVNISDDYTINKQLEQYL